MSRENNILVKLNNAGFKQNGKWLVEGVTLAVEKGKIVTLIGPNGCLLYTSPSPRDKRQSRMPSSA